MFKTKLAAINNILLFYILMLYIMKKIIISPKELKSFRNGYGSEKIEGIRNEMLTKLPKKVKEEVKYRNIKFDYYTDPIELPPYTIPFGFYAKECSDDLKNYLNKFVILVRW
jgi:hypothetical protein